MTKLSKFIICFTLSLLFLVNFISNTFCYGFRDYAPDGYYELSIGNTLNNSNNFYNQNNLKYVFMNNFMFDRPNGLIFYCKTSAYNVDLQNLNGQTVTHSQEIKVSLYQQTSYTIGFLHINYTLGYNSSTYELTVKQNSLSFSPTDVKVPLTVNNVEWTSINCKIQSIPFDYIFGNFYNVTYLYSVHFYQGFDIAWEYDYNNQYFYNNYFGINFEHRFPLYTAQFNGAYNVNRTITLIDNYGYGFEKLYTNNDDLYLRNILLKNNFNYNDSYIGRVVVSDRYQYLSFPNISNTMFDSFYFSDVYEFSSTIAYDNLTSNTLYSSNTILEDVNGSTLIPIGSNNYYKNGEWWDIPTHLYNFFIYLVFDAPIISNFTKLVIIIVNFVVEVFEFLISLFTGVDNLIFSSIFIGVVVLIFLLKIIFKG